jgi:hypothetical protein
LRTSPASFVHVPEEVVNVMLAADVVALDTPTNARTGAPAGSKDADVAGSLAVFDDALRVEEPIAT